MQPIQVWPLEERNEPLDWTLKRGASSVTGYGRMLGVNSYLVIAQEVLSRYREPMSAKAILKAAYIDELVPAHLYGSTQYKTLQARMSEDIIAHRENSLFFRTAPGVFFLRAFLTDESLPEKFRRPITARRRVRELTADLALSVDLSKVKHLWTDGEIVDAIPVLDALNTEDTIYRDPRHDFNAAETVFLWSLAIVRRKHSVLSYRVGRYRDQRDNFIMKRSVGFSAMIEADQRSLFSSDVYGIAESGVNAAKIDLDIDVPRDGEPVESDNGELRYFLASHGEGNRTDLVGVVYFECPDWFEPTKRRLAMHDVHWLDLTQPLNDLSDFDPWSRSVLEYEFDFTPLGST